MGVHNAYDEGLGAVPPVGFRAESLVRESGGEAGSFLLRK